MAKTKKWALKLTVLGDPAVGKTSLINKYVTDSLILELFSTLNFPFPKISFLN